MKKPKFVLRLTGHTTQDWYGDFDDFSSLERKKEEVEATEIGKERDWHIELVEISFGKAKLDPLTDGMVQEEARSFLDTAFEGPSSQSKNPPR